MGCLFPSSNKRLWVEAGMAVSSEHNRQSEKNSDYQSILIVSERIDKAIGALLADTPKLHHKSFLFATTPQLLFFARIIGDHVDIEV